MAIDNAEKRRAASGLVFSPLPVVTPLSAKDAEWRGQAAGDYYFAATVPPPDPPTGGGANAGSRRGRRRGQTGGYSGRSWLWGG